MDLNTRGEGCGSDADSDGNKATVDGAAMGTVTEHGTIGRWGKGITGFGIGAVGLATAKDMG